MRFVWCLSLFLFLGLPLLARATDCEGPKESSAWAGCMSSHQLELADNKLNRLYKKLVPKIAKSGIGKSKEMLLASQRAWVRYRDEECAFVQEQSAGFSQAPGLDCKTEMTEERIVYFQRLLED